MVRRLGLSTIILINLILFVLWWRIGGHTNLLTSIGQMCGLWGLVMLCISIILSVRVAWMEKYFGGMDKIYYWHHMLGGWAFILLLVHPISLTLAYVKTSLLMARNVLLPPVDNWPVYFGISSLLFLIAFLIVTLWIKIPYHWWRLTHKFMSLVFFLGGIHSFFIPSDIAYDWTLRVFVMVICLLTAMSLVYRIFLERWLVKKYLYELVSIKTYGENVFELEMKPVLQKLKYGAGQFVFVSVENKEIGKEVHPFSLASSPKEENIRLMIKNLGDYTSKLALLSVGTKVKIEGAYGQFYSQMRPEADQVWIAGGIGVAPFAGMIRDIEIDEIRKIDFYYCVNQENELIDMSLFYQKEKENKNFRPFYFCSKRYGRVTANFIHSLSGNLKDKEIYICGPVSMMMSLREQLVKMGVKNKFIHTEEFNLL